MQELGTFLGPENRTQRGCDHQGGPETPKCAYIIYGQPLIDLNAMNIIFMNVMIADKDS